MTYRLTALGYDPDLGLLDDIWDCWMISGRANRGNHLAKL